MNKLYLSNTSPIKDAWISLSRCILMSCIAHCDVDQNLSWVKLTGYTLCLHENDHDFSMYSCGRCLFLTYMILCVFSRVQKEIRDWCMKCRYTVAVCITQWRHGCSRDETKYRRDTLSFLNTGYWTWLICLTEMLGWYRLE